MILRGEELTVRVSVIIASFNSRATIGRCLDSLARQLGPEIEVLVADSSSDDTAEFVEKQYPWVRLLRYEQRLFPGAARNHAIAASKGDILAFIDSDCIAAPNWIQRAIEAQQRWGPVVGGSVDNANPENRVGWIYYLSEFAPWMPGRSPDWVGDTPTCCLTVARGVLQHTGPFRPNGYCSDTAFHWRVARSGIRTRFDPRLRVSHVNPSGFGRLVRKMRMHGEHFASVRCEERQLGPRAALLLWMGSPALPVWLLWKRARQVLTATQYRTEFLVALPGVAVALTAWSFGEWCGYGRRAATIVRKYFSPSFDKS